VAQESGTQLHKGLKQRHLSMIAIGGVIGAGLDCHKGRYDAGIKTLEKILDGQRVSYPPG